MNNNNVTYIKILAIFHFIVAGFALLYALFLLIYVIMGAAIWSGGGGFLDGGMYNNDLYGNGMMYPNEFPLRMFGMMITLIPAIFMVLILGFSTCLVIAGVSLLKKKNYIFCMVMAGVACLFIIFGTILGVFTLIVLAQPSSKELFQKKVPPMPVMENPS
jgi:hypothetical protein